MSETPLTAIGDEAIEARIVAWVLGEASAFEVAELERLCAERPELAIFHRRMLALHALTKEAELPDRSWKLPPGKRTALLHKITPKASLTDHIKETRVRHSATRSILSIAACLIFTVILFGLSSPMVLRQRKKADVTAAKSAARQREMAEMEEQMARDDQSFALRTELPHELIEGTPNPIVLPGQTAPSGRTKAKAPISPPFTAKPSAQQEDALVVAERIQERKVTTSKESKPSSPSSSMSKAIASSAVDQIKIPVPDVDVSTPSLDFGDGDAFGTGWGDASGPPREIAANGTRSGDGAVKREDAGIVFSDADGVRSNSNGALADTTKGGLTNDLSDLENYKASADKAGSNSAFMDGRGGKAAEASRDLHQAEGKVNKGKYDEAKKDYENVLRNDPYNKEARRGLEKIAAAKSDYYRAAYDHTRAELLAEVDKAWELAVPAEGEKQAQNNPEFWMADASTKTQWAAADAPQDNAWLGAWDTYPEGKDLNGYVNYGAPIGGEENQAGAQPSVGQKDIPLIGGLFDSKMTNSGTSSNLAQREMIRRQSNIAEAEKLLTDARSSYAAGDYQKAYETYEKSLNLIPDVPENPGLQERRAFLRKSLGDAAVALSMSAKKFGKVEDSKEWLSKARAWDPTNPQAKEEVEVDASAETSAAEEPYSTFSLNISDASFRIAQAAVAKGERPDPAGIKVEQFYNAVDYGDPAPGAGEPVACAIEQAAHPVIPGRNLVRVSLKTAAAGRSASQPLRLTLLVDQSGSMSRADRREAMDKALSSLGGLLTAQDKVNVIGFARTSRLLADGLTGDQAAARLVNLANPAASEGGTNLETAIDLAAQLATRHQTQGAQNRIVLFTDGAANLGDADPQRLADKVEKLRQQGLAFDIAGIAADDLNDNLLGELARKGNGRYSVVGKGENADFAKQLAGAFRPAAENVKVQVRFNPERVSRYKLIGFEKDRLKTEDFRNDKVDAAELAAEEAGVAIYQVETLPEGRGEIGEVSVRFRDTARNEMVERMWTMTHNPSAPAIDQAAPSMQLATLAMLAGEKLKGGPLADAIDFTQLAAPQATVKQAYGQDTRVSELLRMVDALK